MASTTYGYVRLHSDIELNEYRQVLVEAGASDSSIYSDIGSLTSMDTSGLELVLNQIQHGDTLVVPSMARLGNSTVDMMNIVNQLSDGGIVIHFIQESITTDKTIITILNCITNAERERIASRTNEGRTIAMEKGVQFGRKRSIDRQEFRRQLAEGISLSKIAKNLNIARSTAYKIANEESQKK